MPSKPLLNRFEPGKYFHVFNRGNNKEISFYNDQCYYYFLDKYQDLMCDFVDTLAYALLPNHYHFLIKIKDNKSVENGKIISNQFRRLSLTYTINMNSAMERSGSIFSRGLRKKTVDTTEYLKYMVFYIHHNPQKHNIVKDFRNYTFSSFTRVLKGGKSIINAELLLSQFNNDLSDFNSFHKVLQDENRIVRYLME